MKYLVTGAAGFIGSKVSEQLLHNGHEVVGLDDLNNYYDIRLKQYRLEILRNNKKFLFHKIDISNNQTLSKIFETYKFDAILNLAARAGVRYSLQNPHIYMQTNAIGTLNILENMRRLNIKKLVLASTSSLYAGHNAPFDEKSSVNKPISPYASSKKSAELMAYTYHYLYGLDVSVLRYFTVYGPAGRPDMSPFRFIKWISEGKEVIITGNGTQSRDFTYIDDVAHGTILSLKPLGYEVINIGKGDTPTSLNTLIEKIEIKTGKKAKISYIPFPKEDMKVTQATIEKAKTLLGWKPKVSISEGIERTANWHQDNERWLCSITT